MEIKKVVFTFEDGREKVLEGEELDTWAANCFAKSDYLLPAEPDDVLRRFVSPERAREYGESQE